MECEENFDLSVNFDFASFAFHTTENFDAEMLLIEYIHTSLNDTTH